MSSTVRPEAEALTPGRSSTRRKGDHRLTGEEDRRPGAGEGRGTGSRGSLEVGEIGRRCGRDQKNAAGEKAYELRPVF